MRGRNLRNNVIKPMAQKATHGDTLQIPETIKPIERTKPVPESPKSAAPAPKTAAPKAEAKPKAASAKPAARDKSALDPVVQKAIDTISKGGNIKRVLDALTPEQKQAFGKYLKSPVPPGTPPPTKSAEPPKAEPAEAAPAEINPQKAEAATTPAKPAAKPVEVSREAVAAKASEGMADRINSEAREASHYPVEIVFKDSAGKEIGKHTIEKTRGLPRPAGGHQKGSGSQPGYRSDRLHASRRASADGDDVGIQE